MILERDVERRLVSEVGKMGGWCVKFIPDNMRGMPDRLCLFPEGRVLWVETKRPEGGRLAPMQVHRHRQLRSLGFEVAVCWTEDDVLKVLTELGR